MPKPAPARRLPRKAKPGTKGLDPAQCRLEQSEGSAAEAAEAVEKAGGRVVGQYNRAEYRRTANTQSADESGDDERGPVPSQRATYGRNYIEHGHDAQTVAAAKFVTGDADKQ